jgi:RNA polymerase sigma-70 factor (ECF subfamily)
MPQHDRPAEDRAFARFREAGDVDALGEVFDRLAPALLRFAARLLDDRGHAEDVVQQAFVTAIESRDDWDEERRLLPWLLGIVAHRARNLTRRERRRRAEPLTADGSAEPGDQTHPAESVAGDEIVELVFDAIDRLPEPYGPVLDLHLRHGMTPVEIARTLRRSQGTVRSQIHRGGQLLRAGLPAGVAGLGVLVPSTTLAAMRGAVLAHGSAVATGSAAAAGLGLPAFTLPIGILLMKKLLLGVVALGVVALSAFAAYSILGADRGGELPGGPGGLQPLSNGSVAGAPETRRTLETQRESLAASTDATGPDTPPSESTPIELTVVDENGMPRAGVFVFDVGGRPENELGVTDANGILRIERARIAARSLEIRAEENAFSSTVDWDEIGDATTVEAILPMPRDVTVVLAGLPDDRYAYVWWGQHGERPGILDHGGYAWQIRVPTSVVATTGETVLALPANVGVSVLTGGDRLVVSPEEYTQPFGTRLVFTATPTGEPPPEKDDLVVTLVDANGRISQDNATAALAWPSGSSRNGEVRAGRMRMKRVVPPSERRSLALHVLSDDGELWQRSLLDVEPVDGEVRIELVRGAGLRPRSFAPPPFAIERVYAVLPDGRVRGFYEGPCAPSFDSNRYWFLDEKRLLVTGIPQDALELWALDERGRAVSYRLATEDPEPTARPERARRELRLGELERSYGASVRDEELVIEVQIPGQDPSHWLRLALVKIDELTSDRLEFVESDGLRGRVRVRGTTVLQWP